MNRPLFRRFGALLLIALLPLGAAQAKTIRPQPHELTNENLAHREVLANITAADADAGTITATLYEPEKFTSKAVRSIRKKDTLLSGGEAMRITEVQCIRDEVGDHPTYVVTAKDTSFLLTWMNDAYIRQEDESGVITYAEWPDQVLMLPDSFVLLDWVNGATGDDRDQPVLSDRMAFLHQVDAEAGDESKVSFATQNVYLLFDENAQPILARRFHVPWQ